MLEWLRGMVKGGVIYEITVGRSETDEEDGGRKTKRNIVNGRRAEIDTSGKEKYHGNAKVPLVHL